jgi:hypothetical protein
MTDDQKNTARRQGFLQQNNPLTKAAAPRQGKCFLAGRDCLEPVNDYL